MATASGANRKRKRDDDDDDDDTLDLSGKEKEIAAEREDGETDESETGETGETGGTGDEDDPAGNGDEEENDDDPADRGETGSEERHDDDAQVNFSITKRWRVRLERWKVWQDGLTEDTLNATNLNQLELPLWKDLFVDIEGQASLQLVQTLQTFRDFTGSFKDDIALLSNEIAGFTSDIALLEEEKLTLETELEAFQAQRDESNLAVDRNDLVVRLFAGGIADKTGRIADKTALITKTMDGIADKTGRIADKTIAFKSRSREVCTFIRQVYERHVAVRSFFAVVQRIGNDSTIAQLSGLSGTRRCLDKTRVDEKAVPSGSEIESALIPQLDPAFTSQLIGLVFPKMQAILLEFQDFFMGLLAVATSSSDTNKVKATTDAVLSWEGGAFVNNPGVEYARPPTTSDCELKTDHPILHAVICRIIGIISPVADSTNPLVLHPQEHGVTNEQDVAGSVTSNAKARRVDMTAQPREEFMSLVLPIMIHKPIEVKTVPDDVSKFRKAMEKGRSQIVGHLGKRVMCALDFGGAGHNTSAVGVSLTMFSIEVIQVSLKDVGTLEVRSEAVTTGRLPFLEGGTLMNPEQEAALDPLDPQLNANGFVVLAGALMYEITTERLTDITQVAPVEELLDTPAPTYLGSGAFSNVYDLKREGCFLKLPKSVSLAKNLVQEAKILKLLQSGQPCDRIPKCVLSEGVSQFQSKIRGEISLLKGLKLSGVVGIPLHRVLRTHWDSHAKFIVTDMITALEFAHEKKIYHLDVRPGNIIVGFAESGECHAMLSDWGCAIQQVGRQRMKSFRGCTPYAHDRLLGKTPSYKIGKDLDFASLAYTLDHVSTGKLVWIAAFARPSQVSEEDKTLRRKMVDWERLVGLGLPAETTTWVRDGLTAPERVSIDRQCKVRPIDGATGAHG
jgi:Protein kinase domain